jgi:hypothetical protein
MQEILEQRRLEKVAEPLEEDFPPEPEEVEAEPEE